jgi:hypothetical protein
MGLAHIYFENISGMILRVERGDFQGNIDCQGNIVFLFNWIVF